MKHRMAYGYKLAGALVAAVVLAVAALPGPVRAADPVIVVGVSVMAASMTAAGATLLREIWQDRQEEA